MCREALLPCPPHAYIIYDISHLQPREGTGSVFTSAPSPPLFHPSITSPANFARSFLPSFLHRCCCSSSQLTGSLEYWKRRHFSTISWSAVEMLYSERQLKWFKQDMDVPRWEGAPRVEGWDGEWEWAPRYFKHPSPEQSPSAPGRLLLTFWTCLLLTLWTCRCFPLQVRGHSLRQEGVGRGRNGEEIVWALTTLPGECLELLLD